MGGVSERLYSFRALCLELSWFGGESVSVFIASKLCVWSSAGLGGVSEHHYSFRDLCLELSWFGWSQ